MAERKRSGRARTSRSAEKATTEARKRAEHEVGALDNREVADQPSEIRHAAYFVSIVGGALALNLIVLAVLAGGQ